MNKPGGYGPKRNTNDFLFQTNGNGNKGNYLQLIGSFINIIGESLGFYGQIISMIEDEQANEEQEQQQKQMQNQIDQLQQQLQQQIDQVNQLLQNLQINPPSLQQISKEQQGEDMKQQILCLQKQIYKTQLTQQKMINDLVQEIKKKNEV